MSFLTIKDLKNKYSEDNSGFAFSKSGMMDFDITPHEKLVIELEKKYNVLTLDYEKTKCELDVINGKLISVLEQNKSLQEEIDFLQNKVSIEKKKRETLELEMMNVIAPPITKKQEIPAEVKAEVKEFLKTEEETKKTIEKMKTIPKITPAPKRMMTLPTKKSENSVKGRWH